MGDGDGGDYGSILHNSMFWEVFLGLQPSCAAARHCFPVEWFQRILLTTVANTQPERAVQYGMDTIATASLRKGHPYLQYSIGLYWYTINTIFTISHSHLNNDRSTTWWQDKEVYSNKEYNLRNLPKIETDKFVLRTNRGLRFIQRSKLMKNFHLPVDKNFPSTVCR